MTKAPVSSARRMQIIAQNARSQRDRAFPGKSRHDEVMVEAILPAIAPASYARREQDVSFLYMIMSSEVGCAEAPQATTPASMARNLSIRALNGLDRLQSQ